MSSQTPQEFLESLTTDPDARISILRRLKNDWCATVHETDRAPVTGRGPTLREALQDLARSKRS